MRVLIFGATGMVGHSLWRRWRRAGWKVWGTCRTRALPGMQRLNLLEGPAASGLIERLRPEAVVFAASNPYVDYCEKHPEETRRLNVEAVARAAQAAKDCGAVFVFFSSDYVFDGARAPYAETDPVRPLSEYGRQKVEVEREIAGLGGEHLILRVSGVYGWELVRKNFVLQVLDRAARGEATLAASDLRYCPTYAHHLAAVLQELLRRGARGILHASGCEEVTRLEFAELIAREFGIDPGLIRPASRRDFPAAAPRPAHSSLDTRRVSRVVGARLWGAREGLRHMHRTQASWQGYLREIERRGCPVEGQAS